MYVAKQGLACALFRNNPYSKYCIRYPPFSLTMAPINYFLKFGCLEMLLALFWGTTDATNNPTALATPSNDWRCPGNVCSQAELSVVDPNVELRVN